MNFVSFAVKLSQRLTTESRRLQKNKHMKKILLTIALMVCGAAVFAQQGGSLYFLRANADARTGAMGDAAMGEATGMYIYTNPTSFLQNDTSRFYGAYTLGLLPKIENDRVFYHAASVGYKYGKQAFMVGFRTLYGLETVSVNNMGISGNTIKPYDYSIDLSYSRTLSDKFSAYITGTFIQSYIGKTATTGSASGGVYYRNKFKEIDYTIGLGFYDLGGLLKYDDEKEYEQPASVGLGGSFGFELIENHRLNLAWTTRYFMLPSDAAELAGGLGAEYQVIKSFNVRTGYHFEEENSHITVGLGCNLKKLNINIAYKISTEDNVDNSLFMGCSMRF